MSKKLYFIYTRVSKSDYLESISTQLNILKNIAKDKNYKFTQDTIVTEHDSGSNGKRPEFAKMMKILKKDAKKSDLEKEYAGILFYKIDRLFRNFDDFHEVEMLMNNGYRFISGTETIENTPTGRLLFRMLAGFAIYESEKLSNRESLSSLMNALKHRFDSLWGKRPFGYMVVNGSKERFIDKNPRESSIIYLIYTLGSDNPNISPQQILDKIMELPDSWKDFQEFIEARGKKRVESKIASLRKKEKLKQMALSWEENLLVIDAELEIEELDTEQLSQEEERQTFSTEDRALKIIDSCLRNEWWYKYNWLITKTFQINDELIQNFLKSISSLDDEKFSQEFWNNDVSWDKTDYSIGTDITFTFYTPDLAIVDDIKYRKVQESFIKRENKKLNWEGVEGAVFEGLLFLRIPVEGLLPMNSYLTGKNTICYRRNLNGNTIEKSELLIEKSIRKSHLFDNHSNIKEYQNEILDYLETQSNLILQKQIRSERAKRMVYSYQIQRGDEVMREIMKNSDLKDKEQLFRMIRKELAHYSDLRKEVDSNIEQYEENRRIMIAFFFYLLTDNVNLLDKSERQFGYLAMFEKIEMTPDKKTIIIHLRQFMAEILWVSKEYTISLM